MKTPKRLLRSALLSSPGLLVARALARHTVTVLMLHRFAEPNDGGRGRHTSAELRTLLQGLRRRRTPIVPVAALADARGARPPEGAVAFTVDDGYADFAHVAWPIFREFDCPVTVFLTTGFLDGEMWPWWDHVRWAVEHTRAPALSVKVRHRQFHASLHDVHARSRAAADLIETLKRVPDRERVEAVASLPAALGVVLPDQAPPSDVAMSWEDVRRAGREGATFGPHTVTHPILSMVDDQRAETEITRSWERVRAETEAAVAVFCYPNGDAHSFGAREEALVAKHGFAFALTAIPGNATSGDFEQGARRRFRVPRYACPHDAETLGWLTSGWERLRGQPA